MSQKNYHNPPGRSAISYRTGTHPEFVKSMLSDMRTMPVACDDGTVSFPLSGLSTREKDDLSIAFIDACAVVMDVLAFYQERIANEGYLGTLTRKRSIKELAASAGYEFSPGACASAFLSFTTDDAQDSPDKVKIPKGTKVMSVPEAGDELPQTFETKEEFIAHKSLNAVKLTPVEPEVDPIDRNSVSVRLEGVNTGLKAGDRVLMAMAADSFDLAVIEKLHIESVAGYTSVQWYQNPTGLNTVNITSLKEKKLFAFTTRSRLFGYDAADWSELSDERKLQFLSSNENEFSSKWSSLTEDEKLTYVEHTINFRDKYAKDSTGSTNTKDWKDISDKDKLEFKRKTVKDLQWNDLPEAVKQKLRIDFTTFPEEWPGYGIGSAKGGKYALDVCGEHGEIISGTYLLIETNSNNKPVKILTEVKSVTRTKRSGFGLHNQDITRVTCNLGQGIKLNLRDTYVYIDKELKRKNFDPPLKKPDSGDGADHINIKGEFPGLASAGFVRISGKGENGAIASELAYIAKVKAANGNTEITFKDNLKNQYYHSTVRLCANTVSAIHGETVKKEVLGSGNAAIPNQRFILKRKPLAYDEPDKNSLSIRVNGVLWDEVPVLYGRKGNSQCYMVRIDDKKNAVITFGDGINGARPPTGNENIIARYRVGGGIKGRVKKESIKLAVDSVLGVREVCNFAASSGGDDPESLEHARKAIPVKGAIHDRIVSVSDYERFAQTFPGIGKACAVKLWTGEYILIHITVAGVGGKKVNQGTELYNDLLEGIKKRQASKLMVELQSGEVAPFSIKADIYYNRKYIADDVEKRIKKALLNEFSFEKRKFGQDVKISEIVAVIQGIDGVEYADTGNLSLNGKNESLTAKKTDIKEKKTRPAEILLLDAESGVITLNMKSAQA